MHVDNFKNCISLKEAVEKVQGNSSASYEWYAVKTKSGNVLEVGGNKEDMLFSFVMLKDCDKLDTYANGYSKSAFRISYYKNNSKCYITIYQGDASSFTSRWKTLKGLLRYIENTPRLNYKEFKVIPVYKTVLDHYEIKFDKEN